MQTIGRKLHNRNKPEKIALWVTFGRNTTAVNRGANNRKSKTRRANRGQC